MKMRLVQLIFVWVLVAGVISAVVAADSPAGAAASMPAAGAATRPSKPVMPEPSMARPKLPEEVAKTFVITMREPISAKTAKAFKRKVIQCRTSGAELVIIDMDTWGGLVHAALDISRLIKTELSEAYVVCYVRTRGVSAGALISLACDEIVMTPGVGKLGDCAPIVMGGKLEGTEREKIETVLREEFAESAKRNGYHVELAESMVSMKREVWLVRHRTTGETRYVFKRKFRGKVNFPDGMIDIKPNKDADWQLLEVVVHDDELLTMDSDKAVKLGFVTNVIEASDTDPLSGVLEHFGATAPAVVLDDTWSEGLVDFLTSPIVQMILALLGFMAFYSEIRMPGLGVPAVIAVVCFAILIGSHYLIGMAQWWEIGLFVLGLILIALEVFVIPGFGVAGISGIICCVIGLLAMFVANPPDKLPIPSGDLDWSLFSGGVMSLAIAFVLALVGGAVLAQFLPKLPWASRLILAPVQAPHEDPVTERSPIRGVNVGDSGVVETVCRPVGKVRFGGSLLDAVADGEAIEAGAKVRVVRHSANRIVVERA